MRCVTRVLLFDSMQIVKKNKSTTNNCKCPYTCVIHIAIELTNPKFCNETMQKAEKYLQDMGYPTQ